MRLPGALLVSLSLFVSSANALVVGPEVPVTPPNYGPTTAFASLPVVASDGSNYLVLWRSGNPTTDLYAAIVSPAGDVKSVPPMHVTTDDVSSLDAVWNGSSYLLVWFSSAQRALIAARLGADGTLIDTPHVLLHDAEIGRNALAWNGHDYLLAYTGIAGDRIGALLLSPSGDVIQDVTIPFAQTRSYVPQAVAVGDTFYVVRPNLTLPSAVTFTIFRVSGGGAVLDAQPATVGTVVNEEGFDVATNGRTIVIAAADFRVVQPFLVDPATLQAAAGAPLHGDGPQYVTIASNGSTFLVSWIDSSAVKLRTMPLGADGSPAALVPQTCCSGASESPSLASNGSTYFDAWADSRFGHRNIVGSTFDASGTSTSNGTLVSIAAAEQSHPVMAGSLLVGRESTANGGTKVIAVRTGPNGAVGDPVVLSQSFSQDNLAVTFTGSLYFVAWTDTPTANANPHVVMRRLRTDLSFLDPAPVEIAPEPSYQPSLAFDGTRVLAVWSDGHIRAVHLPDVGAVTDTPVTVWAVPSGNPHVAWNGNEYLVVWTYGSSCFQFFCSAEGIDVVGMRLDASGAVLDARPIVIAGGGADQFAPVVSSNGRDFLVGYRSDAMLPPEEIVALRRVDAAGAPGPEHIIARVPYLLNGITALETRELAIARRDDGYIVAYQSGPEDGPVTLHVAHFDDAISGDVAFATSTTFADVALGDNMPLIAYTRFAAEAPYGGVQRLFTRTFASAPRLRRVRR